MEELNQYFDEYMKEFKKLPVNGKRHEVLKAVKEFIAVMDNIAEADNIELNFLQSTEINDISDDCDCSESDYLEALMVYVEVANNLVGEYLAKKNI